MKTNLLILIFNLFIGTAFCQSPGGVSTNLNLWLGADLPKPITAAIHNTSVSTWIDQSPTNNDAVQTNVLYQPTYKYPPSSIMNYNPYIFIDETNTNYLELDQSLIPHGTSARTVTVVANSLGAGKATSLIFFGDASGDNAGKYTAIHLRNAQYRLHLGKSRTISACNSRPGIYTFSLAAFTSPIASDISLRANSANITSSFNKPNRAINTASDYATIGGGNSNAPNPKPKRFWNGNISELTIYDTELNTTQLLNIESYLAIKYGISLVGDYTSSIAGTLWDKSFHPNYHNEIIGLGRDDGSTLYQKQSREFNDYYHLYINNLEDRNIENTGVINNNNSYLIAGHDNNSVCPTASSNLEIPSTATITERIEREFKIHNTSFSQTFSIDVDISSCSFSSDIKILIDDDGDFLNATEYASGSLGITISESGGICTISNIPTSMIPINSVKFLTIGWVITPLPISLISFTASIHEEHNALLEWKTATEINNDYFTLEKSNDGINWKEISELSGAGNSNSIIEYSFIDMNLEFELTYYRLKQTDFDGTYTYSKIESLFNSKESNFSIFPNPFSNYINIQNDDLNISKIELINIQGELMYSKVFHTENNIKIDTKKYDKGFYFLRIYINNKVENIKIIKK